MSSDCCQKELINSVTHSVKYVSNSININNDLYIQSLISAYLNSSLYIITNIHQTFSEILSETRIISINNNNITNSTMIELITLFYNCVAKSLLTNTDLQELQKIIDNSDRWL